MYLKSLYRLDNFYIYRVQTFTSLFYVELNFVILTNFADESAFVNKNVFTRI